MLVVENQHDTKDCPYELLFYPLKMLLTGGAVEFSIRVRNLTFDNAFCDSLSKLAHPVYDTIGKKAVKGIAIVSSIR